MTLTKITSKSIKDNEIVNADLHSAAAIASTKLAKPIDLSDNERIRFGTGNDLEIYHNGTNTYAANSTGILYLMSDDLKLTSKTGAENYLTAVKDGAVELYHNNANRLETASYGVKLYNTANTELRLSDSDQSYGNLIYNNGEDSSDVLVIGVDGGNTQSNSHIRFYVDGNQEQMRVNATGALLIDNKKVNFGNDSDFQIYHDGTKSRLHSASHDISIRSGGVFGVFNGDGTEEMILATPDGAVELYYDDSKKFETTANGVLTSGKIFVEQAGTDQTFLTLNADLGTNNNRELLFKGPSTDSGEEPFRIDTGNSLAFFTDGQESFRILYNRNVGFGTTNPLERLHVGDSYKFRAKRILGNTDGASTGDAAIRASIFSSSAGAIHTRAGNAANRRHFRFYNPNGVVGEIRTNGNGTTFATSSDYRLKENAVRISDGITRLKTLKPYKFNFKANPSVVLDGFFAHEATQIPEAVGGEKDEVVTQAMVDADGYPESDLGKPLYQSIDHSRFVPLLTAALQDAVAKIETLETKVAALEAA